MASCKEIHHPKTFSYCSDLILNPNKIFNLKENYPDIYNDSIISKDLLDSIYLKRINSYIISFFQKNAKNLDYTYLTSSLMDNDMTKHLEKFTLGSNKHLNLQNYDEIFAHEFYWYGVGISFFYLRKDTNYFLVNILESGRSTHYY
jgi:hypothetical protein